MFHNFESSFHPSNIVDKKKYKRYFFGNYSYAKFHKNRWLTLRYISLEVVFKIRAQREDSRWYHFRVKYDRNFVYSAVYCIVVIPSSILRDLPGGASCFRRSSIFLLLNSGQPPPSVTEQRPRLRTKSKMDKIKFATQFLLPRTGTNVQSKLLWKLSLNTVANKFN